MTSRPSGAPRERRHQLAAELRRTRMLAGLPGRDLAQATGVSQSTISRAEPRTSRSLPGSPPGADATGITGARRAVLLALAEAAASEAAFRIRLSSGLAAVQDPVRDLEASARVIRTFQPGITPACCKPPSTHARSWPRPASALHGGHAAALAARLRRQQALHDPDRSLEFLLTEAALRYRPAPPQAPAAQPGGRRDASTNQTRTAQLDHLAAAVTLETISFGVNPADAEMHAITPAASSSTTTGPAASSRWPNVPIVFCEARALAEEWIYRFLAAAHAWAATEAVAIERLTPLAASAAATELAAAPGLPEPSTAEVRAWARATGRAVLGRGRLGQEIWAAWRTARRG